MVGGILKLDDPLSDNTRKQYGSAWSQFVLWCEKRAYDLDGLDTVKDVAGLLEGWSIEYVTDLYHEGKSPSTIMVAIAGIKYNAKQRWRTKFGDSVDLDDTLASIRRAGRGRGRGQMDGLSWGNVEYIADGLSNEGTLVDLRDAAILRVGSDALLRISEIAALDTDDIELSGVGGIVTIKSSKTDQEGKGAVCYLVEKTISSLSDWLNAAGIMEDGPLFLTLRGGKPQYGVRMSKDTVRKVIQRRAKQFGIGGRISGHSLRIGSAQDLVSGGASLVEVQRVGRWKSPNMPAHYARGQLAEKDAVARIKGGLT